MDTQEKKEEMQVKTTARAIYEMTRSDGWRVVRGMFDDTIIDLQSVMNLKDTESPEQVVIEIKARKAATEIIYELLKKIEQQTEAYNDSIDEKIEQAGHIRTY